jgi:ComF family protein
MGLSNRFLNLLFPPKCPLCGEVMDQGPQGEFCRSCREDTFWLSPAEACRTGTSFCRCVCVGWYEGRLKESVRRFKFQNRPNYAAVYGPLLAQTISQHLAGDYDLLSWVPVSPATLKTRGYDQAQLLAEETGKALGQAPVSTLDKTGQNVPQSSLESSGQRWRNVMGVYAVPRPADIAGKRILLIDDILTTGATLEEASRTLLAAGASQVNAAALCRTPFGE